MAGVPCGSASDAIYKYCSLNAELKETRLLRLLPGAKEDPIKTALEVVSLSSALATAYETVSYVWGSAERSAHIYVSNRWLAIPRNTEGALRRMRSNSRERVLWIDAVCINQDDKAERSQQVGMMRDIYKSSVRNLIHLDDDDMMGERIVTLLGEALEACRIGTNDFQDLEAMINDPKTESERYLPDTPQTDFNQDILHYIISLPWFRRLWVVQEARLAPSNVCFFGDRQIALLDVLRSLRWLQYNRALVYTQICSPSAKQGRRCIIQLFDLVTPHCTLGQTTDLVDLLTKAQIYEKSDPKDSVFGILGMLDSIPPELCPDYSLELSTILSRATYYVIRHENDLDILRNVHHREHDLVGSSIPSWTYSGAQSFDPMLDPKAFPRGNAASQGLDKPSMLQDLQTAPKSLPLQGLQVSHVRETVGVIPSTSDHRGKWRWIICSLMELNKHSGVFRTALESDLDGLALNLLRTLGAGRTPEVIEGSDSDDVSVVRRLLNYSKECKAEAVRDTEPDDFHETVRRYGYFQSVRGRMLFLTETGKFGLGPAIMQPGDVIVVVRGAPEPLMLRRAGASYRFLGAVYIDGIMHGEAVEACKARRMREQVFHVR